MNPIAPPGLMPLVDSRTLDARIGRIAWSPDGSSLAVSTAKEIVIWKSDDTTVEGDHVSPSGGATIWDFAWSPDGERLAVANGNETVIISPGGSRYTRLTARRARIYAVDWSPDGTLLATASGDHTITIWDAFGNLVWHLPAHKGPVYAVSWSPDGRHLASASKDRTVALWDTSTWEARAYFHGHTGWVVDVAWSPDSTILASASVDATIRIWDVRLSRASATLEGHTDGVYWLTFSPDDTLLVSTSADRTVRIWDRRDWRQVASVQQPEADYGYHWPAGAVFDSSGKRIAMLNEADRQVRVWNIDSEALRRSTGAVAIHQSTAKVVLLGDSGVGKSGLARVLAGDAFAPTESTHGRSIRTLSSLETQSPEGTVVLHEVVLWDLAGQPGYRVLHSLNLSGIAVAVVVFDSMSDADGGIHYWTRIARQADDQTPMILVGARTDAGSVTRNSSLREFENNAGVIGPLYVSARTGAGIAELRDTIERAIRWDLVPTITSTPLLQRIKSFLLSEKNSGRQLSTVDQLYRAFAGRPISEAENVRAEFDTAIRLLASTGLIEVLSVGDLVLLQPELLDQYSMAILTAARAEPDGLGTVRVDELLAGLIPIPAELKLRDPQLERTLLSATMEEMLRREIALLEGSGDTAFLLFPTETRRDRAEAADVRRPEIIYRFSGPVSEIYASLVVRLQYSGAFRRTAIWRNAIEYAAAEAGTCRVHLRELEDRRGELQLSFTNVAAPARALFVDYVRSTLEKRADRGSVERSRVVICPSCGTEIGERQVAARLELGKNFIVCPVCDMRISLVEHDETSAAVATPAFERSADVGRERSEATALIQGKLAAGDFDVYVSYNGADQDAMNAIARRLREFGILPWILEERVSPGDRWPLAMAEQAAKAKAFAVFIGKRGVGGTQADEIAMLVAEAQKRRVALIPVLLPEIEDTSLVPRSIREYVWVDFRQSYPDPLELLVRSIAASRGTISSASLDERATSETELRRALEDAEKGQDWATARQFLMELASAARGDSRDADAATYAERALTIADDPTRLGGRGLREPLELLVETQPATVEAWLSACHHREASLRELREIGGRRPDVLELLKRAGIDRWMQWFAAPDASVIASLPRAGQGWPSARVGRLHLRNVKSFSEMSFDFTDGNGLPEPVTTFVGDNATGKSTMLQCIALACLGSKFAGKVEAVSAQTLLRNGKSKGAIEVELDFAIDPLATPIERGTVWLGLALDSTRKDLYPLPVEQMTLGTVNHMGAWDMLREQVGLQWGYCGGYGAFRALRERRDTLTTAGQTPIEIDRALSLFQPQATLLEPAVFESILQADISALSREPSHIPLGVRDTIAAAFRDTIPGVEAREVNGRWRLVEADSGVSSPSALSDGCNSMIALLGHMIRHTLELRGWIEDPLRAEGIVLIDEVDLHLHPSWQRNAIPQLTRVFPNLQFIVTTHSPVVLGGVPDAPIGVLTRNEHGQTLVEVGPTVKGWRVDQLLSGVHFEVDTVYDRDTEDLRSEYGRKLTELGPEHPAVVKLEDRLKRQMREPLSSMNPDRDLSALLNEFVEFRLGKLTPEEREQTFARMWGLLRQ